MTTRRRHPPITEEELARIRELHGQGLSVNAIAEQLGRARVTVSNGHVVRRRVHDDNNELMFTADQEPIDLEKEIASLQAVNVLLKIDESRRKTDRLLDFGFCHPIRAAVLGRGWQRQALPVSRDLHDRPDGRPARRGDPR
jgi:hypothetical protein